MGNAEGTLSDLSFDRSQGEIYGNWLISFGELDGNNVSVFSASPPSSSRKRPYIERALQASKILRHPGLLRYIDGGVVDCEVMIVTERATPLSKYDLKQMPALQITAGLSTIIDTLVFLHDRAGVSHNNVSQESIFVTTEGLWKLGCLDYSCSFGDLSRDHIEHINNYCSDGSIPSDDKTTISHAYQHARDCYAFAKLVQTVLCSEFLEELPFASEFMSILDSSALTKDWSKRMRLVHLADHNFFRHDFLKLHHDLTNVLLLPDKQRETFLKSLAESLQQYPEELVASTMSGSLLSHPLFLIPSAASNLLPAVLIPKNISESSSSGLFSAEIYKKYILPPLLQLFSVLDVNVRTILLIHLPYYINLITKDTLQNQVLPEVLLGIRDTSEVLVEATLHGLAHMIPILGGNVVIGSNRQHLFTTAKPKTVTRKFTGSDADLTYKYKEGTKYHDTWTIPKKGTNINKPIIPEDVAEVNSLDNLDLDNLSISQIPERSSPDGGEDFSDLQINFLTHNDEAEDWPDWEESQDRKNDDVFTNKPMEDDQATDIGSDRKTSETDSLRSRKLSESRVSQGFGEEYDIMAIKVKKKHDSELDLFADIVPQFITKKFDLESMLEDANRNTDEASAPTLSATLATLNSETIDEGEGWGSDTWEENIMDQYSSTDNDKSIKENRINQEPDVKPEADIITCIPLITSDKDHTSSSDSIKDQISGEGTSWK